MVRYFLERNKDSVDRVFIPRYTYLLLIIAMGFYSPIYLFSIIAMGSQVVFCLFKKEDVKVYNEKLHIMFPAEA